MNFFLTLIITCLYLLPVSVSGQVQLQTGSAQVNIPLFKFSDNLSRLNSNISLDYHSGMGLLVDNIPGSLGANWQLTGIPKIIRIINGLPDDQQDGSGKPLGVIHQNKFVSVRGCPMVMNYYPISDVAGKTYDDAKIVSNDRMADEFQVTLNGRTIQFYLRTKNGIAKQNGEGVYIMDSRDGARIVAYTNLPPDDNVQVRTTITRFEILDTDGLVYVFNEREYSKLFNYKTPRNTIDADMMRLICREVKDNLNTSHIVTAWCLSKIADVKTQRVINFDYSTQIYDFQNYDNLYAGGDDHLIATPPVPTPIVGSGIFSVFVTLKKNRLLTKHISKIHYPSGEEIEFIYNPSERKDIKGGYALQEIKIKNKGSLNFKVQFITNYFVKNQIKTPATEQEAKWSRLCLIKFKNLEEQVI